MNNPGVFTLANLAIGAAVTTQAQTPIVTLAGMAAVTLEVAFGYGSGGDTLSVTVQTSFDRGSIWRDVARFDFSDASAVRHCTIAGLSGTGITDYADLAAEDVNPGLLGDCLRAVVTSTGVYADTTLAVRASVR